MGDKNNDLLQQTILSLSGVPADITELKTTVKGIDDTLRKKEIADAAKHAKQDEKIETSEENIDKLGAKVRVHVDGHWRWIFYIVSLVGVIMGVARFLAQSQ